MLKKIGFSGARSKWTDLQQEAFIALVGGMEISEYHTTDRGGIDGLALREIQRLHPNAWTEVHPQMGLRRGSLSVPRCKPRPDSGIVQPPHLPAACTQHIVRKVGTVIIAPASEDNLKWSMASEALRLGKPVIYILPSGRIELKKQRHDTINRR